MENQNNLIIGTNCGLNLTIGSCNILIGENLDVDYPEQSFLLKIKVIDNDSMIQENMTYRRWEYLFHLFHGKGLAALLNEFELNLPPGMPDVQNLK